jgi:actin related protein 2/3 complex, subunit 2
VLADFDGVTYRISTPEIKTKLNISMSMHCFGELRGYGADSVLGRIYGPLYQAVPEAGFDVTLTVDLTDLPADKGLISDLGG